MRNFKIKYLFDGITKTKAITFQIQMLVLLSNKHATFTISRDCPFIEAASVTIF